MRLGHLAKRGVATAAAVIAGGLLFGFVYQRVAERYERGNLPRPGRLVDVGGHRLYLSCTGEGSPTVVLDSALGVVSYSWTPIQAEVSRFTRVCSYDRAGYGLSDPGPLPRTSKQLASELHSLLGTAEEAGPYVLVGHSLGGLTIRLFTQAHPAEVAGLVLVDSASENAEAHLTPELRPLMMPPLTQMKFAGVLAEFGMHRIVLSMRKGRGSTEAQRAAALNLRRRAYIQAAIGELEALPLSTEQVRSAGKLGDRPLIVLTRGPVHPGEAPRGVSPAIYENFERIWRTEIQATMVGLSTRGEQRFAKHSGHMIPQEEPEAVIDGIREVVSRTRLR
uniref:Alpha/beta hydrolase fold n=1 Tax=Solibacter usitatus (strain Ellin6076) TaxID=234267 RepID=Q022C4_SOLUE